MKAFVYDRKSSKKIDELPEIDTVFIDRVARDVHFIDYQGIEYVYSMKDVKTTTYQN